MHSKYENDSQLTIRFMMIWLQIMKYGHDAIRFRLVFTTSIKKIRIQLEIKKK